MVGGPILKEAFSKERRKAEKKEDVTRGKKIRRGGGTPSTAGTSRHTICKEGWGRHSAVKFLKVISEGGAILRLEKRSDN